MQFLPLVDLLDGFTQLKVLGDSSVLSVHQMQKQILLLMAYLRMMMLLDMLDPSLT